MAKQSAGDLVLHELEVCCAEQVARLAAVVAHDTNMHGEANKG